MKQQIDPNDFPRFLARGNVKECYVGDKWPDRVLKVSPVGKSRLTPLEIDYFEALRGYVWVESIHQIPSGRLGNGMRILEQIS